MANVADIKRAAKHIDAVELDDGNWAHYATETSAWWVVSPEELAELCEYLDSDDEEISSDAYSHWCSGGPGKEMPEGWEPDMDPSKLSTVAYVTDEGSRVVRVIGQIVDGSRQETRLAEMAPAGTSLVALECDAKVGDTVVVSDRGVATAVAS